MFIVKLFYGILLVLSWLWLIKYRKTVKSWTGNFLWAERHIWAWWTYIVIILTWAGLIFFGVIYPFWWVEMLLKK